MKWLKIKHFMQQKLELKFYLSHRIKNVRYLWKRIFIKLQKFKILKYQISSLYVLGLENNGENYSRQDTLFKKIWYHMYSRSDLSNSILHLFMYWMNTVAKEKSFHFFFHQDFHRNCRKSNPWCDDFMNVYK